MKGHIIVTGGSGFVGLQICNEANLQQIKCVGISRTGRPENTDDLPMVDWVSADIFKPTSWRDYLNECVAVIHTIAILKEQPALGQTYEHSIYESAKLVADESVRAGIPKLVLFSAIRAAPGIPAEYMEAKLAAEQYVKSCNINVSIIRPGILYGAHHPESIEQYWQVRKLLRDPNHRREIWPVRPMPVTAVAKLALAAALSEKMTGILTVDDIEKFN